MRKGSHLTEENKLKISKANKGRKLSEETKEKIRNGNLGVKRSAETRRKISKAKIGHEVSKEVRKIISKTNLGNKYCVGREYSEKTIKKMSKAQKGDKHWNWLGGRYNIPYSKNCTLELRNNIRKRDNYCCQECRTKKTDRKLDIHQIDYDKENSSFDNLITLCRSCHIKTNYNRKYWTEHFNNLMRLI